MASKISGSRKLKRSSLPKFNRDIYSGISSRNLFVYSVHYLLEQEIEIRMEDIVFACFLLFPQKFALKKYPRWPDSAVVSRRMNDCRSRRYIAANTDPGIKLTAKGSRLAEKVAKVLGVSTAKRAAKVVQPKMRTATKKTKIEQKKKTTLHAPTKNISPLSTKKTKPSEPVVQSVKLQKIQPTQFKKASLPAPSNVPKEVKIRAGKFVHLMERSDAYLHYKKEGKNSKIGEFDFRSLLLCTMESSRETLVKNVALFKGYAGIHKRQDLLTFLDHCEDRFSYLLAAPQKQLKKRSREREFHG